MKLESWKIEKLNKINFPWNMKQYHYDQAWLKQFNKLKLFRKCNPNKWPSSKSEDKAEKNLSHWCSEQRVNQYNLETWRINKLTEINFNLTHKKQSMKKIKLNA